MVVLMNDIDLELRLQKYYQIERAFVVYFRDIERESTGLEEPFQEERFQRRRESLSDVILPFQEYRVMVFLQVRLFVQFDLGLL
jgi:hypothetical protein